MNRKQDRIVSNAARSAIRASRKGHSLSAKDDFLNLRVQILPTYFRVLIALIGLGLVVWGFYNGANEFLTQHFLFVMTGAVLILFALVGVRKTLSRVLDAMDIIQGTELLAEIIKCTGRVIEKTAEAIDL